MLPTTRRRAMKDVIVTTMVGVLDTKEIRPLMRWEFPRQIDWQMPVGCRERAPSRLDELITVMRANFPDGDCAVTYGADGVKDVGERVDGVDAKMKDTGNKRTWQSRVRYSEHVCPLRNGIVIPYGKAAKVTTIET